MRNNSSSKDNIKELFKKELENAVQPLLERGIGSTPALVNTVILLICVNIDLFGALYSGEIGKDASSAKNATRFMREYLGRIDERYRKVGGLLYNNLRHGWVHQFGSKHLLLNNGIHVYFGFNDFENFRNSHLRYRTSDELEGKILVISIPVFYKDLLLAIDLYAEDAKNNDNLADKYKKAYSSIMEFEKENELLTRSYIEKRDFEYIYSIL